MKNGNKCCGCVADQSKGTSAGQSAPTSGGDKTSGGIKPIEDAPEATILLPYFECDLNDPNKPCTQP